MALSVSEPWAGPVTSTAVNGLFSMSESLANTLVAPPVRTVTVPPSAAVTLSATPTGASFTAVTASVMVWVSVSAPPEPVLPPSSMWTVSVTSAVALAAVVNVTLLAAMKALILATVPFKDMADAVPPTVTPPPDVAESDPLLTERVTTTELLPASTSLKLMPVNAPATSSVTAIAAGTVATGASFTAVTFSVMVPSAGPAPAASRMRLVMLVFCDQLAAGVKVTPASAAFTSATEPVTAHTPETAS